MADVDEDGDPDVYVANDWAPDNFFRNDGEAFVDAVAENAYSGDYPLARFLYLYVNYKPGSQLEPLRREFIRYVFSRQGQEVVIKDGYLPITANVAAKELAKVENELVRLMAVAARAFARTSIPGLIQTASSARSPLSAARSERP